MPPRITIFTHDRAILKKITEAGELYLDSIDSNMKVVWYERS